jgi:hypothetical protein
MIFAISAFVLVAAVMLMKAWFSRKPNQSTRCQRCGTPARFMKPYFMCDTCEDMVGVRIGDTNYF